MSGSTGKMTEAEIRARGPRMVLGEHGMTGQVIYRQGQSPFKGGIIPHTIAVSYRLSYLQGIGKARKEFRDVQLAVWRGDK